ncbi:glycerophosphodiester phosphodiesterase [Pseudalgibacter alginicilyticus]|uniref:Glycerophosphodiester phosphodiesterase n=1 Tax=Pseudalgibacter alginicilyticus TaxID=1736674 RepID=A0A0P0CEE2_9FLAO|nr:glycerophosphodiester phosphodiesterase family protein [Pseudalgibacter alginicilyticus]ALJ04347.1 glycerophosphodiester phosphodiesterase [Pseudalgibacter alginicilyticus]
MNIYKTLIFSALIVCVSCKSKTENSQTDTQTKIQIQGHRGERGNLPENSIEGFLSALHKGVDVLELDVIISKDHQVVVSHEPYMSSLYMTKPSGDTISKSEEKNYNLYHMTYDSIKTFDGGSKININFPYQQKMKTYKPLLSEVLDVIENEIKEKELPSVKYNIEIKSNEEVYGIYQPNPDVFVDLVMQVIQEKQIKNKVNIQSFDPKPLNILHKKHPEIEIAFLVSKGSIKNNLKLLDFKPQIYSPHFKLVDNKPTVDSLKSLNIKLIPWTVNNEEDIKNMINLKVNAIITDYPERVMNLLH